MFKPPESLHLNIHQVLLPKSADEDTLPYWDVSFVPKFHYFQVFQLASQNLGLFVIVIADSFLHPNELHWPLFVPFILIILHCIFL